MDFKTCLFAAFVCIFYYFGSVNAQETPRTIAVASPEVQVEQGTSKTLSCDYSGSAGTLLSEKVHWYFQAYNSQSQTELSINGALESGISSTKYRSSIKCENVGPCMVYLTVNDVESADDGTYKCQLRHSEPPKALKSNKEINFVVINPVQELTLVLKMQGGKKTERLVAGPGENQMRSLTLDQGAYEIECTASGSNPKPQAIVMYGGETKTGTVKKQQPNNNVRAYQEKVTVTGLKVDKTSKDKRFKCTGNVPNTGTTPITATFRISDVTVRDPKVECKNASGYVGDKNRKFSCTVYIDEGPIQCNDAYWVRQQTGNDEQIYRHASQDPYQTVELACTVFNDTAMETTLTVTIPLRESTFKETYSLIYNSPVYNTVRKENQMNQYVNGASHIEGVTSMFVCVIAAVFTFLL